MIKLIKANIYRMLKNKTLYIFMGIAVLLSVLFMFFSVEDTGLFRTDFTGDVRDIYMFNPATNAGDYVYDVRGIGIQMIEYGFIVAILASVYISMFAGKFFDEGAIRNLVITGHRKSSIYLSVLVVNVISTFALSLTVFISTVVYTLICSLNPIIWWPYVLIMAGVMYLVVLSITSLTLLVMFLSRRTYVAVIASVVILAGTSMVPFVTLNNQELVSYVMSDEALMTPEGFANVKSMTTGFDDQNYRLTYYMNGEAVKLSRNFNDLSDISKLKVYITKAMPMSIVMDYMSFAMNPYIMTESGACLRYSAVSVIWIAASAVAGVFFFRKKDII